MAAESAGTETHDVAGLRVLVRPGARGADPRAVQVRVVVNTEGQALGADGADFIKCTGVLQTLFLGLSVQGCQPPVVVFKATIVFM